MSDKKALIVIDMQNDYLYEKRKKKFSYDTPALVAAVNGLIREYEAAGCDVIYVRHIIQNLPTNRLLFGFSIAGTEGAELYSGLEIVSGEIFDKMLGDAFTNKKLLAFVREKGYAKLSFCGLDECGCVRASALGAVKRGLPAEIVERGTATVFPDKKRAKTREKLNKAGVCFV